MLLSPLVSLLLKEQHSVPRLSSLFPITPLDFVTSQTVARALAGSADEGESGGLEAVLGLSASASPGDETGGSRTLGLCSSSTVGHSQVGSASALGLEVGTAGCCLVHEGGEVGTEVGGVNRGMTLFLVSTELLEIMERLEGTNSLACTLSLEGVLGWLGPEEFWLELERGGESTELTLAPVLSELGLVVATDEPAAAANEPATTEELRNCICLPDSVEELHNPLAVKGN